MTKVGDRLRWLRVDLVRSAESHQKAGERMALNAQEQAVKARDCLTELAELDAAIRTLEGPNASLDPPRLEHEK